MKSGPFEPSERYRAVIAAARAAYGPDPPSFAVLDSRGEFLRGTGGNAFSQYGEDGILAAVFEKIGVTNRWCFEVGAGDGIELSNTKALRDDGWSAELIEKDAEAFRKLLNNCGEKSFTPEEVSADPSPWLTWLESHPNRRVFCIHAEIDGPMLNGMLEASTDPDGKYDLGVIDIDGKDAEVFDALRCRPRVMLVEYNALGDGPLWPGGPWQAGFDTVCRIGRKKGYVPLCRTSCNLLFALESELPAENGV
jgi:hypothetical protein